MKLSNKREINSLIPSEIRGLMTAMKLQKNIISKNQRKDQVSGSH
jgi:hypothetical protein